MVLLGRYGAPSSTQIAPQMQRPAATGARRKKPEPRVIALIVLGASWERAPDRRCYAQDPSHTFGNKLTNFYRSIFASIVRRNKGGFDGAGGAFGETMLASRRGLKWRLLGATRRH
jgi:hypothetical protein